MRWGEEPDLLVPDLVAGRVLGPAGETPLAPEDEHYMDTYRRTPWASSRRFGLSLSPAFLNEAGLPAYAARGAPDMGT